MKFDLKSPHQVARVFASFILDVLPIVFPKTICVSDWNQSRHVKVGTMKMPPECVDHYTIEGRSCQYINKIYEREKIYYVLIWSNKQWRNMSVHLEGAVVYTWLPIMVTTQQCNTAMAKHLTIFFYATL